MSRKNRDAQPRRSRKLSTSREAVSRRRRQFLEQLEDRRLLAGTPTNYIVLDFTPDNYVDEIQPSPFATIFDGSPVDASNRFLNYVDDGRIDINDAKVAARKITGKVRKLFEGAVGDRSDVNIRYIYTPKVGQSGQASGAGEQFLERGLENDLANSYVVYVGGAKTTVVEEGLARFGVAFQGLDGPITNEYYSFVWAGEFADYLQGESHQGQGYRWAGPGGPTTDDFTNSIAVAAAHEIGHLLGLGHLVAADADPSADGRNEVVPDMVHDVMNHVNYANPKVAKFPQYPVGALPTIEKLYPPSPGSDEPRPLSEPDSTQRLLLDALRTVDGEFYATTQTPIATYASISDVPGYSANSAPAVVYGPPTQDPGPSTQGTLGDTSAADVATVFANGLTALRNDYLDNILSTTDLQDQSLPFITPQLGEALGVQQALEGLLEIPELSSVTDMAGLKASLEQAGFDVVYQLDDAELAAAAADQPGDLLRVSITYDAETLQAQTNLDSSSALALSDLAGTELSGTLDLLADGHLTLTLGVDTGGFYLLPGDIFHMPLNATGAISGTAGANGSIQGRGDVSLRLTSGLANLNADNRVRLGDIDGVNAMSAELDGAASLTLDMEFATPAGNQLQTDGQWNWEYDKAAQRFVTSASSPGFDEETLLASLAEYVDAGLDQLDDYAGRLAQVGSTAPFFRDGLPSQLETLVAQTLAYDNAIGSIEEYFDSRGISIVSSISSADLVSGNYLSKELLQLHVASTASNGFDFAMGGTSNFDDGENQLAITASGGSQTISGSGQIELDFQIGMDAASGVYLLEGSSLAATVDAEGSLAASADLPGLFNVAAAANLDAFLVPQLVISDGDATLGEKHYLTPTSLDVLFGAPQEASLQGTLSKCPVSSMWRRL